MRLEVIVCLIIGAGSGIGQATAWLFAKEGTRVKNTRDAAEHSYKP